MRNISHFRPELLPLPAVFYQGELGKLTRANRKGWAMCSCPFHNGRSKSFSVNLDSGGFHCFGCEARGGDIVSFIRLRDRLSFKEACQSLGCWDKSPSPETVRRLAAESRERERQRQAEEARQAEEHRRRMILRDRLHTAARLGREISDRLQELCREGSDPAQEETCWAVLSLLTDYERECDRDYCRLAGLEYCE